MDLIRVPDLPLRGGCPVRAHVPAARRMAWGVPMVHMVFHKGVRVRLFAYHLGCFSGGLFA